MDHPSEGQAEVEMLAVADPAVSNEPEEEETSGELVFFPSPEGACCRFCGLRSDYRDCG